MRGRGREGGKSYYTLPKYIPMVLFEVLQITGYNTSPYMSGFLCSGIPIDMVGGTSIGALVGALYCEDRDAGKVEVRAREFSMGMCKFWEQILDLTYPSTSMFTGTNTLVLGMDRWPSG